MEFHIVKKQVDKIISQGIKAQNRIEHTLDDLLNHLRWDRKGEEEFLRLNLYYLTINKDNALQYYDFYKRAI